MYQTIYHLLEEFSFPTAIATPVAYLLCLAVVAAVCLGLLLIIRPILVKISGKITARTKSRWDDIFFHNKLFHRLSYAVIPVTISFWAETLPQYGGLIGKLAQLSALFVLLALFDSFIKSCGEIYNLYSISRLRPIRSLLQVIMVVVYIVGLASAIAILAGQSIAVLLGGVGAATAIISLIFKDAILGFVAGIQLTTNDMIRIGDWIEMPKYLADGTVVELSMTTVKVENFNKTITTIPAYTMISDAFVNWRSMEQAGARRIKRAVYIVADSICFCSEDMLARFRNIELLRGYLSAKLTEVQQHNSSHNTDMDHPANGRRLTNIGTFRAYLLAYLQAHPGIRHDMPLMVRQLDPDDRGLPLELYAFTNVTQWERYESIQADIFDHLYAVAPEFGLSIYQKPTSNDIRRLANVQGKNR